MVVVGEKVLLLIEKGVSLNKISKLTGISKSTLYFHYKKLKGKKTIPIKFNFKKKEELGEFLGIFAGDGSFFKRSSGHYVIRVYSGYYEKDYADYLTKSFLRWFSKKPMVYFGYYKGKESVVINQYYSKEIYDLILKYLEWGEHRKTLTVRLKSFELKNKSFNKGFLRGLIDTDGSFYAPKRRISFSSISKYLADQASQIMASITKTEPKLTIVKKTGRHDLYTLSYHGENTKKLINSIQLKNRNKNARL